MINPKGMHYCGNCGRPLVEAPVHREKREVSIVFIDLTGFSAITHDYPPEKLRDFADEVLTMVANTIEEYDGYVDAFTGDGLIALFGAPHSHPDDAYRAVKASFKSLKAIELIGDNMDIDLKGRAGVNTGTVIAGSIGSGRIQEYTVMGTAVNLAARIEAAAIPGEVWVGPQTYAETKHKINYKKVANVSLKSFPDITEIYRLISLKLSDGKDLYADIRFVGRRAELERIKKLYERTKQERHAQTLWVTGEAGAGKTRLMEQFILEIPDEDVKVIKIEESFLNIEGIWWQFAKQVVGVQDTLDKSFEKRISLFLDKYLGSEDRWKGYILESLGLKEKASWRRLERRTVERSFLAWRDLLSAVTAIDKKSLIIIVENSSHSSRFGQFLDLFDDRQDPILILRLNRRIVGNFEKVLALEPLTEDEAVELVNQIADPRLQIATKALLPQIGKTPSSILELGRSLSLKNVNFSNSLASLLQARFDKLSPIAKQILGFAALIGKNSWKSLILELSGENKERFLEEIVAKGLLNVVEESQIEHEQEYSFQSTLIHQAVLKMIPSSERPRQHLRIANWLEEYAPKMSELIARHFFMGNFHEAAYSHFVVAAETSARNGDFDKTRQLFERVMSLELAPRLLVAACFKYAEIAKEFSEDELAEVVLTKSKKYIVMCETEVRLLFEQKLSELRQSSHRSKLVDG